MGFACFWVLKKCLKDSKLNRDDCLPNLHGSQIHKITIAVNGIIRRGASDLHGLL